MSGYKSELPDLSGGEETLQTQGSWSRLLAIIGLIAVIASFATVGAVLFSSQENDSIVATPQTTHQVASGEVIPMVSKEDLDKCPEWHTWAQALSCVESTPGGVNLISHWDDDVANTKLPIAEVRRFAKDFKDADARVVFVYPSMNGKTDEELYAMAATDVGVDINEVRGLPIYKVSERMPGWQIWNTMGIEDDVFTPFHDLRTDVDQVRISLAPLDNEGKPDMAMAGTGWFASCGNQHALRQLGAVTSQANTPVSNSTPRTIVTTTRPPSSTTRTTTPNTSTTITTPNTSTTITTPPTTTTITTPPCVGVLVNGLCKDYGNGAGSSLPPTLQPTQLPTSTEMHEPSTPTVPSMTSSYTTSPPITTVRVDPTLSQEPTSSAPPPAESGAPVTTTEVANLGGL